MDPSFGTGVMTITPWHDHTDFDIAERHQLDKEQIIDFQGRLLANAGEFAEMPIETPTTVSVLPYGGAVTAIRSQSCHNRQELSPAIRMVAILGWLPY